MAWAPQPGRVLRQAFCPDAGMLPGRASALSEVFSPREIARAAGVPRQRVLTLLASGVISTLDGEFVAENEAIRAVSLLAGGTDQEMAPRPPLSGSGRPLFALPPPSARHTGVPLALSGTLHGALIGSVVLLTTVGLASTEPLLSPAPLHEVQLVFLAQPGPGGGGGGGGLRHPDPPPPVQRKGTRAVGSPLRPPEPVAPREQPEPPEPVLEHEPLPPIAAPLATLPADRRDRAGVLISGEPDSDSHGSGSGGGTGQGTGIGLGEGDGPGLGPGSGGGTGGGPYRPGSGIEPPRLLHEVQPVYTDEARRRWLEGEVLLEIVVRRDGSVGGVRVLRGLGAGLEQRAIEAVRQWRFAPAQRLGAPVDVVVEVAVEFRMR